VTKAITAAVIATLNVNIRFRPLAHCNSETKKIEAQRLRGLWWPAVCGIAESAKANLAPFGWHSSLLTLAKLRL
jgi:hypothetical protein